MLVFVNSTKSGSKYRRVESEYLIIFNQDLGEFGSVWPFLVGIGTEFTKIRIKDFQLFGPDFPISESSDPGFECSNLDPKFVVFPKANKQWLLTTWENY